MTDAELVSNGIASVGLLVAICSVAIAARALWRTGQTEKREREAIIVVSNIWSGTPGLDGTTTGTLLDPMHPMQWIDLNPPPASAEQLLVIAMESIDRSVLVRQSDEDVVLELRTARPRDLADHDGPGGHNTHYVMLEIHNVGRWAATGVKIYCTVDGTFLEEFGEGTIERAFPEQALAFEVLAPNEPCYVQIRNMTGLPVTLAFDDVSVSDDQPIRLAPASPVNFQPRGYRS